MTTTDSTMPESTTTAAPEPVEPPPAATVAPETPSEPESRPEAGDDFTDADRAALKKVVDSEREAAKTAKAEAERLRTEQEADRARIRELEAAELRREVATDKRLTPEQAELLVGEDLEQLSAHADRLLTAFAPPSRDPSRRPIEALRPGTGITINEAPSASDIAADVLKG